MVDYSMITLRRGKKDLRDEVKSKKRAKYGYKRSMKLFETKSIGQVEDAFNKLYYKGPHEIYARTAHKINDKDRKSTLGEKHNVRIGDTSHTENIMAMGLEKFKVARE